MNIKKFAQRTLMAAVIGLVSVSPASHAALINGLFGSGINQIQDTDVERILDSTGALKTSGAFAVGDIIQSILRFDTVNIGAISDTLPAPYQLTAFSELKITGISTSAGITTLTFGASGNLFNAGSMVDIYERTSSAQPTFSQTIAPATAITNIKGQTFLASFGLNGIDDFWTAQTINNIGALLAGTASVGSGQVANGVFGLSTISNPGGLPITTNGILSPIDGKFHDVVGDASVFAKSPGVNAGWQFSSNLNANFTVPEPGTIALLGLGLLSMGAAARRRKSA